MGYWGWAVTAISLVQYLSQVPTAMLDCNSKGFRILGFFELNDNFYVEFLLNKLLFHKTVHVNI